MLTTLKVRNNQGAELTLPFEDADGGYAIENIDGLDPVPAVLVSSSFANTDGGQYQSSRRDSRNIIITLSLEPDYVGTTIESLRTQLYQYFMTESKVDLTFSRDDGPDVVISGRVETFDAPRFAKDIKATISILCFNPNFTDSHGPKYFIANTTPTLVDEELDYIGTVESGFIFSLNVNRSITGFTLNLINAEGLEQPLSVSGVSLVSGDLVKVSTVFGDKYVKLTRGGVTTNLLYAVAPSMGWPTLYPGPNQVRVMTTPAAGAVMPYQLEFRDKFGGL